MIHKAMRTSLPPLASLSIAAAPNRFDGAMENAQRKVTRTLRAGAIGPIRPIGRGGSYTGEGMAIDGRDLYLLPEDGPSRMFHFRLDERGGDRPA